MKLFGTDGIRGMANTPPMTADIALKVGMAAGHQFMRGTHRHRVVFYPISHPDPNTGLSMINWIAELTVDNAEGWQQSGWFRPVPIAEFAHHFDGWTWMRFSVSLGSEIATETVRTPLS